MVRVLFALALCLAAASAFVAPANHAVASPAYASTTSAKMMPVEVVDVAVSNIAQNANLIATASGDFGGYSFPVIGIGCLAAFILYLSPPLADE